MSSFDVLCLRSLIATAQEEDECLTALREIHAVTWSVMDPQLAYAFADTLAVAQESGLQAIQARPRRNIPKIREPLSHGRLAVDSLVLANLHGCDVA